MAARRGRIFMVSFSLLTMRTIDFADKSISYKRQENLIRVTSKDKASGKTASCLVEPHVASKHFAKKLAAWKSMSRSKK
jgi:hypothetical protein